MKVKKIIMSNGNEYKLLWDETAATWDKEKLMEDSIRMINIESGWVELSKNFISEIIEMRDINNIADVHNPKARHDVIEHYGEAL
jgi:hypothetical protein